MGTAETSRESGVTCKGGGSVSKFDYRASSSSPRAEQPLYWKLCQISSKRS